MRALAVAGVLALLGSVLSAAPAAAYTVEGGDMLLRPVAGASVNVLRYPAATRATPSGGMLLGLDFDYSIDGALNVTAAFRPVLSPSYVDANLGVGVKYRVVQLGAPFIPYGTAMLTGALGGPLGAGALHTNAGLRLAGGVDYFVMRDLAVGVELGAEGSALFLPTLHPEASTELLIGVTFRL